MSFRPLEPWIKGNESITPENLYRNLKPDMELGAFVVLEKAIDLYLANSVKSGNLYDSWKVNKEYIEKVYDMIGINEKDNYLLDNEEKQWILEKLGEPPKSGYNLYFITIHNEIEEKLVYIGKSESKRSRFMNGHLAALKLHNPIYQNYNKRIYFGTAVFLSAKEYIPLEFIRPYMLAKRYLGNIEAFLIDRLKPELNVKHESAGELKNLSLVHIQNFSEEPTFMRDCFVYGNCDETSSF